MTSSFLHERLLLSLLGGPPVADLDRNRIDPETFAGLCRRHRAAGLAHRAMLADPKPWPEAILRPLKGERTRTLGDNLVLLKVLGETAEALGRNGIRFVLLKGASLLGVLYPEIELRPMGDIDLLIPERDWPAAARALGRRGYILPPEAEERFFSETWYHQTVISPDRPPCSVELHWNIESSERSRVDPEVFFRDAVPVALDGRDYLRLSDDHLLLHLLVHLAHHFAAPSLHWLVDIRLLLARGGIDWDRVEAAARAWRLRNCLGHSLAYLERVFPGSAPEAARRFRLSRERRWIQKHLASSDPTLFHRPLEESPLRHAVSMSLLDRWMDAGRYVAVHSVLRLRRLIRPLPAFPRVERRSGAPVKTRRS